MTRRDSRQTSTRPMFAAVMLFALGGLLLFGALSTTLTVALSGQAGDLLGLRELAVFGGAIAAGVGLVAIGREVLRETGWARPAGLLALCVVAVLIGVEA